MQDETMRDETKGLIVVLALLVVGAALAVGDQGCTPQVRAEVATDLGPVASCAMPILVSGLVAGQPVEALIDLALTCAGATIDGLIALVEDLEKAPANEAGVAEAAVPATPAALAGYRLNLAELHAALLKRKGIVMKAATSSGAK